MNRVCKLCEFWVEHADRPAVGECRRNPPVPVAITKSYASDDILSDIESAWPDSRANDWCGEFSKS